VYSAELPLQAGFDVDCDATAPGTLVKVLESGFAAFTLGGGRVAYSKGACLNAGQGVPVPPCGGSGEAYLQSQVKLAPCEDATAQGWSVVPA
jgi:hypothetical protein